MKDSLSKIVSELSVIEMNMREELRGKPMNRGEDHPIKALQDIQAALYNLNLAKIKLRKEIM